MPILMIHRLELPDTAVSPLLVTITILETLVDYGKSDNDKTAPLTHPLKVPVYVTSDGDASWSSQAAHSTCVYSRHGFSKAGRREDTREWEVTGSSCSCSSATDESTHAFRQHGVLQLGHLVDFTITHFSAS
jgi:hypothetical protein